MKMKNRFAATALLAAGCIGIVSAQPPAGGRAGQGAAQTWWVPKTKGGDRKSTRLNSSHG